MLTLKFKKLSENVILPTKAHESDACFDVYSPIDIILPAKRITKFNLNFAVACPHGYKLCFYSRSGLASRGILLTNSVGIIDADYRGCCGVAFYNAGQYDYEIKEGDRILQFALEKVLDFNLVLVDELNETERGSGGFGSTGK